jgi:Tfp pilus assembly protein PilP
VAQSQPEAKPKDNVQEQAQLPNVVPLPPPPPVMAPDTVSLRTIPNYTHTLVGVLELGDRSAALFEINGVARRIYVGESIGASGWMLVKVAEGEATMRRNGEIRSVFVGEQF